jgi:hypothetical protein
VIGSNEHRPHCPFLGASHPLDPIKFGFHMSLDGGGEQGLCQPIFS